MDLDGFIKLNDAQLRWANGKVDGAGKMADVAMKYAQIALVKEQVLRARLENIAKALDIQWDSQAHAHLLKIRNLSLQRAKRVRDEADQVAAMTSRLGRLLSGGGSWISIRDGWIAFIFFRARLPVGAAIKAGQIVVTADTYEVASWIHPDHEIKQLPPAHDPGSLWAWAAAGTYLPRIATPAWDALAGTLQAWSEAAEAEAAALSAKADQLAKDALELSKIDWDRLKVQ